MVAGSPEESSGKPMGEEIIIEEGRKMRTLPNVLLSYI